MTIGNITMSNYKITGLGTPSATTDFSNYIEYVDALWQKMVQYQWVVQIHEYAKKHPHHHKTIIQNGLTEDG